ncbi:arylamine N-acetyltransferase 1-like [Dromiciops gliroides]|uniref:arylamine N-acetyltransferase 1-like n=1 Tax=Dromiciops gliroides TaxID=33562 RepID=UPI001CC7E454|nr:arylamine N-acetyltransferase 1-like [Dromiciops gliroides]XP_043843902.1 arylamine N-acetyltransferase 1-like [Dromiciops gliroides]XP_043843903.1 arylamine N-acetyltransferase 1-like [Dromiciops gliroides]XP_043843904.1 arylamine N-acetyltransferase 1-like [Dromiciops gliroides]
MDIREYFARIGYNHSSEKLGLKTLNEMMQHHVQAVPFENLDIHCGIPIELSLEAVYDKIVRRKRGGWCLEVNHLLFWVLTTMGYETTLLGGYVYNTLKRQYSTMIHLLLKVTIGEKAYIVDGAFGRSYQIWQPVELVSGKDQPQTPCIFRLKEDNGIWYLDQIRRKQFIPNTEFHNSDLLENNEFRHIYSFTLQPRTIEEFESVNIHLQTSPESVFTSKSFCSLQTVDGVHCLVGWTLTHRRFNYKENTDLVEFKILKDEDIEKILKDIFNISLEKKFVPKHGDKFFNI